jgi:LysM repeat protein
VRPGDTLTNIAARAGTTWQALAQANCIANPNYIYVGQVLRVPIPVNPGPYPPPNPYPPNPYPPHPQPGVQYIGAVIPNPYLSAYGGQYQLQAGAVVNLVWAINPSGLTRVDFYYAGAIIGTDTYFGDGVSVTWLVPSYVSGYLNALGYSYSSLRMQTAQNTLVYTSNPNPTPPPTQQPPVVVGSGLSISPFDSVNNNTFILPPDQLITFSWPATFPTATERVVFELIPPGGGTAQAMGIDTNLADGASIIWNAVLGTQGTVRAVAYFTGGYPPQTSDSYYIIAGNP